MIFFCKDTKESQVAKIIGIRKNSSHAGLNKKWKSDLCKTHNAEDFLFQLLKIND